MKNRPEIDPVLAVRILNLDIIRMRLEKKYLPRPPAHLVESVFEILDALERQREMLVNKI